MRLFIVATSAAAALFSSPAFTQHESHGTASIPDFSGAWNHPVFPWFEPPASGPGPITNLSRWAEQRPAGATGSAGLPPSKDGRGVSDYDQLVGDYNNPILQPWAAEVVKRFGELSLAGITYGNPSNQCWPEPPPFIYKQGLVLIIQQPDKVIFVYNNNMDVRRVRLNVPHEEPPTRSVYGDSVGHYECDTLVIDTVGVRTNRPYAMIDLFGTPYTKALHIVERYSLRDYDAVKDAIERNKKENWLFDGDVLQRSPRQVPAVAPHDRGRRGLHDALDCDPDLRARTGRMAGTCLC
jgi:hypothetical protein